MAVLGGVVVLGFFFILYMIFLVEMPEPNKDIGLILLGVLGAKFGDVIAYFYGSSKGSSDKTALLTKNTENSK